LTIHRQIVKLRLSPQELAAYTPPKGVDMQVLEWIPKKQEVIVEFISSDNQPEPEMRKTARHLDHELATHNMLRNRVVEKLRTHHKSQPRSHVVQSLLNHPQLPDAPAEVKKAFEAAKHVHNVELSHEHFSELQNRNKDIKPKEVRQQLTKKIVDPHSGEIDEYHEDRMIMEMGTVDSDE
jgi:hypothetical protein